jgi:hypothetical protein
LDGGEWTSTTAVLQESNKLKGNQALRITIGGKFQIRSPALLSWGGTPFHDIHSKGVGETTRKSKNAIKTEEAKITSGQPLPLTD